ncbi:RNA exonuclease ngl2 [Coemansia biformis]|uniref:RNA exonuclease ngl2 n=1 Tax=Coemansia biformis TaxID=1286918 RepID=A0A9W7Y9I7_9FUNG|nr:RNA exonuclease ngl2 [Coemansia biformis]
MSQTRAIPGACRDRRWLPVAGGPGGPALASFTVMSYNVLCQKLIQRFLFPYASKSSLKWKTRRPLLLDELTHLKPDVMCLQEVFNKNWDDTFTMWFQREGYEFRRFQSKAKSHCVSISWNKDMFVAVDEVSVNMDRSAMVCGETLETDNVALIVVLRLSNAAPGTAAGIIVSNTHLLWHPNACYERLQQQIVLARALKEVQGKYPGYPMIACGDYNTTPDDAGYDLLTKPRPVVLSECQLDNLLPRTAEAGGGSDAEEDGANNSGPVLAYSEMAAAGTAAETEEVRNKKQKLALEEQQAEEQLQRDTARVGRLVAAMQAECQPLVSCYGTYVELDPSYATPQWNGEPIYTNYAKWKGTLDYIFFSPGRGISVREVFSLPAEILMKPGLPNETFASDHVSVLARFSID